MNTRIKPKQRKVVYPTAADIAKTAATIIPFYRKITCDAIYGRRWAAAVKSTDLGAMLRLFRQAVPLRNPSLATNGIGYFLDVLFPAPLYVYTNGTSLRPGTTQFRFSAKAHRLIAAAILPLYRTIAGSKPFASALAEAIRRSDQSIVERLVRSRVSSRYLHSVTLTEAGFAMGFRIPNVRFTYYNEFFREYTG